MIIKITGAILIFISSSLFGIYYTYKIKFHISDLKKINTALNIFKSEIEFGVTQLNEAAKNIAGSSNFFIREMFNKIAQDTEKKSCSAKNIWVNAIDSIEKKIYADHDDILTLKSFANVISNIDPHLQINSLASIISQLEKKISLLEVKYQNEKKLYYNLGFLFGLLFTIILF